MCENTNQINLKELHKKANLTHSEFAKKLNYDDRQNRICKWEREITITIFPNLFKPYKFYGVTQSEIYSEMQIYRKKLL